MIKDKETLLFAKKFTKLLIVLTICIYICVIFVIFIKAQSKPIIAGGLLHSNSENIKYEHEFIKEIKEIVYFPRNIALIVSSVSILITEFIIYLLLKTKLKKIND